MSKKILIGSSKVEYYKGLLIKADNGLHDQMMTQIKNHVPVGATILDFGAGEGAFSMRLKDNGYNVVAFDMDKTNFKANDVEFYQVNFNNPEEIKLMITKYASHFDAIIGMEVIEHVENPWEYIRLIRSMLKTNGHIFISTPNVTNWLSRFKFLFTGKFMGFDTDSLSYGHINPVTDFELKLILETEKFYDIKFFKGGLSPLIWVTKNIMYTISHILVLFFFPFMKGIKQANCIITVAKKNN